MRTLRAIIALHWLLLAAASALAAGASLKVPERVAAGSKLAVQWTGPGAAGDFIAIDTPGSADNSYGPYAYPSAGNPLTIQVPDAPGNYVVRYHVAAGYAVIASAPLVVTEVSASLEAAPSVDAGATLAVRWKGPNNQGDFVSIDTPGADDRSYGPYDYPANANPVQIKAPETPGDYVVRYHTGNSYRVLATIPLRVGAVGATLTVADHAAAGSDVAVRFSGPANEGDFISIDPKDAEPRAYGSYDYPKGAKSGSLTLRVPDEPGDYQVRYHLAASYAVIGTAPLRVDAVTATLAAPASVVAGGVFDVRWTGPNNTGDFVTVVTPGTPDQQYGASNGYTQRGNPVRLEAPREPGAYELRYLTGQRYRTLGKAALTVTPSAAKAKLRVVSEAADAASAYGAVELVLDASGSMLQRLGGVRRIEIAKNALSELTRDVLPADSSFALRVFGHKQAGSCRTDLELPLARLDRAAALARIQGLTAMNLAKTPIAASLLKVREDLASVTGPALVVLVTDGEETCDGDPKAAIRALRAAGRDVRVDIVGFAVDEVVLKETFREWARLGDGAFFDAQDAEQLRRAMRATLRPSYQVIAGDRVVATGTVNGDALELPAGRYRVRLGGKAAKDLGEVVLEAAAARELRY